MLWRGFVDERLLFAVGAHAEQAGGVLERTGHNLYHAGGDMTGGAHLPDHLPTHLPAAAEAAGTAGTLLAAKLAATCLCLGSGSLVRASWLGLA